MVLLSTSCSGSSFLCLPVSSDHNLNLVFCSTLSFLRPHLVITHQAALAGESSWLPSPSPVRLALQGLYTTNMDVGFSPSMALGHLQVCLDGSAPLLNPPKSATCIREPHGDSGATVPGPTYDSHHQLPDSLREAAISSPLLSSTVVNHSFRSAKCCQQTPN